LPVPNACFAAESSLRQVFFKMFALKKCRTHELCVMCSYVIRFHGLCRVMYETPVPTVGGVNSKFPVLTDVSFWEGKGVPEVIQIQ
jgi:tRNA(Arg) A34 adenosine deaminase TadA